MWEGNTITDARSFNGVILEEMFGIFEIVLIDYPWALTLIRRRLH